MASGAWSTTAPNGSAAVMSDGIRKLLCCERRLTGVERSQHRNGKLASQGRELGPVLERELREAARALRRERHLHAPLVVPAGAALHQACRLAPGNQRDDA